VQIKRKRQEGAAAAESLGAEIKREIIDGIRAERESSHVVRLGDFLPQLAFLFIVVSTAIKIAYAGRATAEARAAEAQKRPKRRASSARWSKRGWRRCRRRSSRISCSTPWRASIT